METPQNLAMVVQRVDAGERLEGPYGVDAADVSAPRSR